MLQSPFSNGGGGSPPQEPMADSRFTYVPAASVADAGVVQAELAAPAQAMGQELASGKFLTSIISDIVFSFTCIFIVANTYRILQ